MSGKTNRIIALDTSVLIHHANNDAARGKLAAKVLNNITNGKQRGMISTIVLTEFLSLLPPGKQTTQKREETLQHLMGWLLSIPNLDIMSIDASVAIEAARLRQRYKLKTPDAINLASAIKAQANVFVTSDKKLAKCKEINIKLL